MAGGKDSAMGDVVSEDWSQLTPDILREIAANLAVDRVLDLMQACASWREALSGPAASTLWTRLAERDFALSANKRALGALFADVITDTPAGPAAGPMQAGDPLGEYMACRAAFRRYGPAFLEVSKGLRLVFDSLRFLETSGLAVSAPGNPLTERLPHLVPHPASLAFSPERLIASLPSGASEEALAGIETEHSMQIPEHLRCLWRLCGGQRYSNGAPVLVDQALTQLEEAAPDFFNLAFFGGYSVYDHRCAMFLLTPEAAAAAKTFLEDLPDGGPDRTWLEACLPFAADGSLLKVLFVATRDQGLLKKGAVYSHSLALGVPVPVSASLGAFLLRWGRGLAAGRHRWNAVEKLCRCDMEGSEQLANPDLPSLPGEEASAEEGREGSGEGAVRWEGGTEEVAVTGGFRISAGVLCLHEKSRLKLDADGLPKAAAGGQGFTFAYKLRMEYVGERGQAAERSGEVHYRLERRKWLITDTAGQNSEVDGEGVVGQFPDFSKGTVFEYASCCPMRERVGEMRGEFLMRDLRTGSAFPVRCPTIYLDAFPPSSRF